MATGVSSPPDFHRAGSFQELTRLAEGMRELKDVLDQPVSGFLESLPPGAARLTVAEMVRTGELRSFRDALRNAHLRAEVRWRGGRPGESQLLRGLQDWLARAMLAARVSPGGSAGASPRAPAEPEPAVRPSGLWPGMPPDALEAWAREHGVSALLDLTDAQFIRVLEGRARAWVGAIPPGSTLRQVLGVDPNLSPAMRRLVRRLDPELQEALFTFLEVSAEDVAIGLAEEAEIGLGALPPPADPASAELWSLFLAERERLRALVSPLPRARREGWSLGVSEDPPLAVVQTTTFALCGRTPTPKIQVSLQGSDRGPLTSCACRHAQGGCALQLAAVELCLEALRDPALTTQARAMARSRGRPAWERLLHRLDPLLDEPEIAAVSGGTLELGWRLRWRQREAVLEPVGCKPKKGGRGVTLTRLDLSQLRSHPWMLSPPDARAAARLLPDPSLRPSSSFNDNARILHAMLELVGHPRVFVADTAEPVALRRDALELCWDQLGDGGVRLAPAVGGRRLTPGELLVAFRENGAGDLMLWRDPAGRRVTVLEVPPLARALVKELFERGDTFPPEATPALFRRLPALSRILPCVLDPRLRGEARAAEIRPLVFLEVDPGEALVVEARVRPLADGPSFTPGEGADEVYAGEGQRRVYARRDREAEPARVRAVLAPVPLPPEAERSPFRWVLDRPEAALAALEALQERGEDLDVIWRGVGRRKVARADLKGLSLALGSKRDWFAVGGGLEVEGGSVPVDRLLAAIQSCSDFVSVDGLIWVRLTKPFREALGPLAAAAQETRSGVELSGLHAPLVDALAELGVAVDGPEAWRSLVARARAAEHLDPPLPEGLNATLRDYQRQGYAWMARLATWSPGACLADDMGLGKTLQALALLVARADLGPAMVVAPTSVCFNWAREAGRFAPGLRVRAYRGAGRQAMLAELGPATVLVTSYDVLARDAEALSGVSFATLILDEAQALKNPGTRRARAVFALDAAFRLALTGTPVENRSTELWSLFHAIAPGLLGSAERFRARYAVPIERDGDADRRRALSRLIRPFLLRRLKSEVARELPARTEIQVDVTLSRDEAALYDQIRRQAVAELSAAEAAPEAQRRIRALAALTKLRQAACHPRLISPELPFVSSKVERLREILAELRAEGHRALIFSQFVRLLALVRESLSADGFALRWLDGATPERQRRDEVDAFQRGEGDAFLISLKAGGTGLNLTAATYVIHLDPWWNPAVEDQATDRAHRIGQDQPVTVYRLVARGTLEETILAMHAEKRALASDLLSGAGESAALSADDLLALLSEGAALEADEEPASELPDTPAPDEPWDEPVSDPETPGTAPDDPSHEPSSLDERLVEFESFLADEVVSRRLSRRLASQYLSAMSEFANWLNGEGRGTTLADLQRQRAGFLQTCTLRPKTSRARVMDVFPKALETFVSYGQAVGWE